MDFRQRSYEKELLDGDAIPFAHIKRNMEELNIINTRLGGHRITLKGLQALIKEHSFSEPLRIAEIGCGGGDNLRVLKNWAGKRKLPVQLTGIDINADCIVFAQNQPGNAGIEFIHADFRDAALQPKSHIIFSSLFCHHFTDDDLLSVLQWKKENCTIGFFINDLHRHPVAYYSIKTLTQLFSKSYLVKNDAPLSVRRGFIKQDWQTLLKTARLKDYSIHWQWAFRWLVIGKN